MNRLSSVRNVLAVLMLSLTVLPACSTQQPTPPHEQQQPATKPPHSVSKTNEALNKAGGATVAVVVLGVLVGLAALPVLLVLLL